MTRLNRLFLPLVLSCWTLAAASPTPLRPQEPVESEAAVEEAQDTEPAPVAVAAEEQNSDDPRLSGPCTRQVDENGNETQACPRCALGSRFGNPLVVDGQHVSDLEIMRYVIYGPGRPSLELRRLNVYLDRERAVRQEQGLDLATFTATEEEYEHAYAHEIDEFNERFPTLDLDTEIARAYRSVPMYYSMKKQTVDFDKMFFPGQPIDWPDVTKEAINQGVMVGQPEGTPFIDLVADAQQGWEQRKAYAEETGEEIAHEDEMFMGLLRDYVIGVMSDLWPFETALAGLPEDILMRIYGEDPVVEIMTEEVWEEVSQYVTTKEISDTKLFLALVTAAQQKLQSEDALIPLEEFRAEMDSVANDMSDSMFSFEFLALESFQFPSVEAYRRHLWLMQSFEKSIAHTLESPKEGKLSPAMAEHLERANNIMGLGKVDAEFLLVSAFDWPNYKWKEDGGAWAEKQANELKAEIDAHLDAIEAYDNAKREAVEKGENIDPSLEEPTPFERFWAEKLDLHSEFWDPPMPATGKAPPMQGMKLKGRFGLQTRNDLYRQVGESPFTSYLAMGSVTDQVFFDMETGTVAGPFAGPHGFYLVYLKNRTAPTNPLRPSEPRHVDLLREDYVRRTFSQYSHDCLQELGATGI